MELQKAILTGLALLHIDAMEVKNFFGDGWAVHPVWEGEGPVKEVVILFGGHGQARLTRTEYGLGELVVSTGSWDDFELISRAAGRLGVPAVREIDD